MKRNKKRLLVLRARVSANFLIIALFALVLLFDSCDKSSIIGLDVLPESDLLNADFKDSSSIISYTLQETPFKTAMRDINLLGSYNDPIFGKTSAAIYTQVVLPVNITADDSVSNFAFDSLVLTLPYSGYYGTLESQTIKVYQLIDDLSKDSSYYSNRSLNYNSMELASVTFKPTPNDSVRVNGINKKPHLRIKLSDQLGGSLVSQFGTPNLKDNTAFLKFFKGLYLSPSNSTQQQGEGAILYFNLNDALARMTLYYRRTVVIKSISNPIIDSSYIDTTNFAFEINTTSVRFNHFEHDYSSSSSIVNQLKDSSLGQDLIYLQPMAGLKTKIKIPYLKNWADSGSVAVHKAELVLKIPSQYIGNYSVPSKLFLFWADSLGNSFQLLDEGESYFGGDYNSSTQEYRFNIARHVQAILDGKIKNYGFYLLPQENSPASLYANRLVLVGGGNLVNKMKLRLTYTKLY